MTLVGAQGTIHLLSDSRIATIYGMSETVERYHCNYGLHPQFQSLLEQGEMRITDIDSNDEVRVIELMHHPFFAAPLFQPELSAFADVPHPLIGAFLQALAETSSRKQAP